MSMDAPGYEQLAAVLQAAYDQAAAGKGAERHADGKPFHEQPMQTGSDMLGTDAGLAFQAIKKIREGSTFAEFDRFERELLGAINYIAGMVIWRRRQMPKPTEAPMTYKERIAEIDAQVQLAVLRSKTNLTPHPENQRVVAPALSMPPPCPECGCGPPTNMPGIHYATCSKLTAPKEFVEQVEATFDELENPEPVAVCEHCGSREGAFHHADCHLMRKGNLHLAKELTDLVVGQESPEFLGSVAEVIAVDECTPAVEDPFAGAPEWAKYKAQDADGEWWFYSHAPKQAVGYVWGLSRLGGKKSLAPSTDGPNPNWRDTLIERP